MDWANTIIQGILLGGHYALNALGLTLIFGIMRLVNIAHGDFATLAAFFAVAMVQAVGINPLLSLVLVVPLMFGAGYFLQRALLNNTMAKGILPPLLVTFGLSIIIQNLLLEIFSADSRGLNAGWVETASINLGTELAIGWFPLIAFLTAVGVIAALQLLFARTMLGRVFRATSDNQRIARLMGINNRHVYGLAMGLALAIVAVAGVYLAIRTTITPASGPDRLLFAFEVVIIGGLGSLWGTLAGGVILGIAQTVGAKFSPGWGLLAGHLVFLAVLAFRPTGLFMKMREQ